MKYSNNGVAETLVKAMGARSSGAVGSWASGMPVVRASLIGRGLDLRDVTLVDGSGLSTSNRLTARVLVNALRAARASFRFGPEFTASLPLAGLDGTLEKRAQDSSGRMRAKTGLLTSVTSLSGYVILGSGEVGAFSILANGIKSSSGQAMDAIDRFVAELARPSE
jgi:D-alanyl-D-alanine carboxypeptidase/D-alanyl-D-alanine-endopeptidase (penicillin-binding protein 4)